MPRVLDCLSISCFPFISSFLETIPSVAYFPPLSTVPHRAPKHCLLTGWQLISIAHQPTAVMKLGTTPIIHSVKLVPETGLKVIQCWRNVCWMKEYINVWNGGKNKNRKSGLCLNMFLETWLAHENLVLLRGEHSNTKNTKQNIRVFLFPLLTLFSLRILNKSLCARELFSTDSKVRGSRDYIHGFFSTLYQLLELCLKQFGTINICETITV